MHQRFNPGVETFFRYATLGCLPGVSMIVDAAEPAERFRLDLTTSYFQAPMSVGTGFTGGVGVPLPRLFISGSQQVFLFDAAGTLNLTDRLSLSAGVPFGVVIDAPSPDEDADFGIGDTHAELGYQLFGGYGLLPALSLRAEMGAPTASSKFFANDLFRATGRVGLSKAFNPSFSVFADASYSHFFEEDDLEIDPVVSYGGGLSFGITPTRLLVLQVEQVEGGERREDGQVRVADRSDLRATVGTTLYHQGRPRVTFALGAANLQEDPTVIFTARFAVLSF